VRDLFLDSGLRRHSWLLLSELCTNELRLNLTDLSNHFVIHVCRFALRASRMQSDTSFDETRLMIRSKLFFLPVFLLVAPIFAQEKSVNPGINKSFENPSVPEFVERFEREGRDAFDHRKEIVVALGLEPGMAVADVGAGTGLFTRMFSPLVGDSGKVYAVDISEKFVAHIGKIAAEQKMKNIIGVVCTSNDVRLPSQSVDLVFICDTYHHFEFPSATMRSIHKALKPKGQVVLIDFHRIKGVSSEWAMSHVRAGQEVFVREIVDAGFKQVDEKKDMLKESYFVRFEKIGK
jgi:ubiquinone/menaquinone biosynthesis C-methylase UbiE